MKELIKKILREQEDDGMDTHAEKVQDLKSADDLGGWRNPITDDSPGNVPPNSYMGQNYTQILCKMKDASWFTQNEELDDNLWQRQQDMSTPLKVLGINEDGGLTDKIFWAANDNREGIVGGSITGYDQLYLRPLIQYDIPLFESVREYKTVSWVPTVECYSKEDAFAMVR